MTGVVAGARGPVATAGPWRHTPAPAVAPEWVSCAGYGSLVAGREPKSTQPWVTARALAWVTHDGVREAIVVDIPLGNMLFNEVAGETGVAVKTLLLYEETTGPFDNAGDTAPDPASGARRGLVLGPANISIGSTGLTSGFVSWATLLDFTAWDTGTPDRLLVQFDLGLRSVYEHLSGRINEVSIAQYLLIILALVAVLFLIILAVAFLVGFVLARSITGAVHELFEGTEKVRGGDFSHKIVLRSRDQLGQLAESFNSMTASMEDLLQQKAQ